jgi:hypothetical protein
VAGASASITNAVANAKIAGVEAYANTAGEKVVVKIAAAVKYANIKGCVVIAKIARQHKLQI